jgi:2-polyprenyl-3-methyl-5-hydroxy-6-metoxy-1,4-benzoquinol methylase
MIDNLVKNAVAAKVSLCPLCRGVGVFSFSKQSCDYYRCACGFVFVWPRPLEEDLRELYRMHGEEYWTTEKMVKFVFSPTKSSREIQLVHRFAPAGSLLDVGCSTGGFVKAAGEAGYEAEGVDISARAVEFGRQMGLRLEVKDVLHADFHRTFDIVTLWATLEHLGDPVAHLRAAHRVLKSNGYLFVSVPNYSSLSQKLLGSSYRYVVSEHLNYFTPKVLQQTVEACGFEPIGRMTYGFNPLRIAKDLINGAPHVVNCEEAANDATQTLTIKSNAVLLRLQALAERGLDYFLAADVIVIVARKL